MKTIAFIGAPGVGKSTLAYGLYYNYKISSKKVELIPELAKYKVYQGVDFSEFGFNVKNMIEQLDFENKFFENQFDYLITEAPICVGFFYSSFYNDCYEINDFLYKLMSEKSRYNLYVFVKHSGLDNYEDFGRNEDITQSLAIEKSIEEIIRRNQSIFPNVIETTCKEDIGHLISMLEV